MNTVGELKQAYRAQQEEIEELKKLTETLLRENQRLSSELTAYINRLYRKSSESLDPRQLRLFAEELSKVEEDARADPAQSKKKRTKSGHGRSRR